METKVKRKSVAMQIAEHFGSDIADIRDYDYQPGNYSPKVYSGMDGNYYWSAGPRPPKFKGAVEQDMNWQQVKSSWPNNPPLWRGGKP